MKSFGKGRWNSLKDKFTDNWHISYCSIFNLNNDIAQHRPLILKLKINDSGKVRKRHFFMNGIRRVKYAAWWYSNTGSSKLTTGMVRFIHSLAMRIGASWGSCQWNDLCTWLDYKQRNRHSYTLTGCMVANPTHTHSGFSGAPEWSVSYSRPTQMWADIAFKKIHPQTHMGNAFINLFIP